MSVLAINNAFEEALAALTPALPTVWENDQEYDPTGNEPYQLVAQLPAQSDNPALGSSFHRERGYFQVTLKYPKGQGTADVKAQAELIKTSFPRGRSMSKDGVTVIVEKTPEISPGYAESDRYCVPVKIRYFANI